MATSQREKAALNKERTESLQSNRLNVVVSWDSSPRDYKYTRYAVVVYLVQFDAMWMKKVKNRNGGAKERSSAKPNAIVLAALELFTRYGYRKTSIDAIAQAAQVAKRTVYLHFENKAAVFLAILEYLGDQVRQRCVAAESIDGAAVDRLTAL